MTEEGADTQFEADCLDDWALSDAAIDSFAQIAALRDQVLLVYSTQDSHRPLVSRDGVITDGVAVDDFALLSALRDRVLQGCSMKDSYRSLLTSQGDEAQRWLDALQTVLDYRPGLGSPIEWRSVLKALLRLSKSTGLYPSRLHLGNAVQKGHSPVAGGGFGDVYRGSVNNHDVAIKVFRVFSTTNMEKFKKTMWKEAIIWCQLYHSNVLPCYGVYHVPTQPHHIGLVSPWVRKGNVVEYLRENPTTQRTLLLLDIASGMSYLHENKIVHGDLKGVSTVFRIHPPVPLTTVNNPPKPSSTLSSRRPQENILVSESGRACLVDFGLSKLSDPALLGWTSIQTRSTGNGGTTQWQAPEMFNADAEANATAMTDVYSYGCVCYEIMTGKIPFFEIKRIFVIPTLVSRGDRPRKPDLNDPAYKEYGLTDCIWEFIEMSWNQNPDLRPTAQELEKSEVLTSLTDNRPVQHWGNPSSAEFRRWMFAPSA